MLTTLLTHLYAHTTMTQDDVMYIAKNNGITINTPADGKLIASKDGEEITFDATSDNGLIYIFDI